MVEQSESFFGADESYRQRIQLQCRNMLYNSRDKLMQKNAEILLCVTVQRLNFLRKSKLQRMLLDIRAMLTRYLSLLSRQKHSEVKVAWVQCYRGIQQSCGMLQVFSDFARERVDHAFANAARIAQDAMDKYQKQMEAIDALILCEEKQAASLHVEEPEFSGSTTSGDARQIFKVAVDHSSLLCGPFDLLVLNPLQVAISHAKAGKDALEIEASRHGRILFELDLATTVAVKSDRKLSSARKRKCFAARHTLLQQFRGVLQFLQHEAMSRLHCANSAFDYACLLKTAL